MSQYLMLRITPFINCHLDNPFWNWLYQSGRSSKYASGRPSTQHKQKKKCHITHRWLTVHSNDTQSTSHLKTTTSTLHETDSCTLSVWIVRGILTLESVGSLIPASQQGWKCVCAYWEALTSFLHYMEFPQHAYTETWLHETIDTPLHYARLSDSAG